MKSILLKNLVILIFILSIGSYVAYRVGAFDQFFAVKKDKEAAPSANAKNKKPTKNLIPIDDPFDDLMTDSKSSPFVENEQTSTKRKKTNKSNEQKTKKDLMPGPKSAEVIDLEEIDLSEELDKVFEKPKLNMPNQNEKKTSK